MGMPTPPCDKAPASDNNHEEKLEKFEIRKADMNRLVMNFLVLEGLIDAAKTFEEESGTKYIDPPPGLIDRIAVNEMIFCGDVDGAIAMVCRIDPQIIHSNELLRYQLYRQKFKQLLASDKVKEALDFAHEKIAPLVEECPQFRDDLESIMVSLLNANFHEVDYLQSSTSIESMNKAILSRQIDREWLTIRFIAKKIQHVEWEIEQIQLLLQAPEGFLSQLRQLRSQPKC